MNAELLDMLLKSAAIGAGTLFWCWFLVWENEQRAKEAQRKKEKEDGK